MRLSEYVSLDVVIVNFFLMKKIKFAIVAFFFLIQIGELILPLYKSTLAKNIVEITEKERNTLTAN